MVVLIIGIVMAAGIPSLMTAVKHEGINKAMTDMVSMCEKARAQAIMSGQITQLHIQPQDGTMSVEPWSSGAAGSSAPAAVSSSGSVASASAPPPPTPVQHSSEKLPENVAFEMLDVNLTEYNAATDASVRFFPDGRCDEMVAILLSDKGERRALTLEITTGLVTVYDDPKKLLSQ